MIKYNGYYRDSPTPYEDGIANYWVKGYVHAGYFFLSNGTYIEAVKKSKSKQLDFLKSDFNPDFPNKYEVKGNKLIMFFETGTKWEFSEIFNSVTSEELKSVKRQLRFVSW